MEMPLRAIALVGALFLCALRARPEAPPVPVFKADSNLQSISVEVSDGHGHGVRGLASADFTILENGRPQQIAFFGAQDQPIDLTILLDSSGSMKSSDKLKRAQALLRPLLRGNMQQDTISLLLFTDEIGPYIRLTPEQRLNPPYLQISSMRGGTALYDAVATTVCRLRSSGTMKQAVVVITDGADQNSRLRMEELIPLVRSSRAQIFVIGFVDQAEADSYRQNGDEVTLVSGREVDNPLRAFRRIAKESGAEAFLPASNEELKRVLNRILGILRAQYTLAYYPKDIERLRKIQIKVNRAGVTVRTRRIVSASAADLESVQFNAGSCQVSGHPYPWESHVSVTPSGTISYHENFADTKSGWPNRPGSRYAPGAYEMTRRRVSTDDDRPPIDNVPGTIAAYGPWWGDFRASVSVESHFSDENGEGIVFRLNDEGCYILLLTRNGTPAASFKLIKRTWPLRDKILIPWTRVSGLDPLIASHNPSETSQQRITVECKSNKIAVFIDAVRVAQIADDSFLDGYVGMAQFGYGRVLFRDLRVQSLP